MNLIRDLVFLVLYFIRVFFIVYWRKQKKDPSLFFYSSAQTFAIILTYSVVLEIFYSTFYLPIPLVFLSIFTLSYFSEKRRLLNGLLSNVFLISFGIYLFALLYETQDIFLGELIALVTISLLLVLLFGIYGLIVFPSWDGATVLRRESRSLANLLTLMLAIFLTLFLVFDFFLLKYSPRWISALFSCIPLILIYLSVISYNFLTVLFLYQFNRLQYNQNLIVVLGTGLINGETVSPLLVKRINRATAFYWVQSRAMSNPFILLMSGGQGADEKVPEAITMRQYAMEQGVPGRNILVKTNSTTILENMRYSKETVDQQMKGPYCVIFSSNSYHIFRAGLYARQAKSKADGVGAKAVLYYLPNVFLREYITTLMMNKKRYMIICGLLFAGPTFLSLITLFFQKIKCDKYMSHLVFFLCSLDDW